ncbi:MAG: hypothetical protein IT317_21035 [Anaerolineales bacterium]|nr:hypothetical protein [Anaerolineales bacterium]
MAFHRWRWLVVLALAAAGCGRATPAGGPSLTPTPSALSASATAAVTPGDTPTVPTESAPTGAAAPTNTGTPTPSVAVNSFLPTASAPPPTAAPPQSLTAANAVSVTLLAAFGPGLSVTGTAALTATPAISLGASARLEQVVWGPGAGQVAVAGAPGVLVYDRATGALAQRMVTSAWATSLALWPEGHALAAGTLNATVEVYDARDGELRVVLTGPGVQVALVRYAPVPGSVLPGGYAVASLGVNNTLHWWDVALQTYLGALTLGPSPAQQFDLSPRAPARRQWLAAAAGSTVRIWALPGLLQAAPAFDAVPPALELTQPAPLTTLALSADGRWLAAASTSGTILIWDLADPSAPPQALARQAYPAEALAFSPSSDLLASAHGDQLIRLWAVGATGLPSGAPVGGAEPLATLAGHSDRITSLAFSPDGRELASTGWEGVVRVWGITDF